MFSLESANYNKILSFKSWDGIIASSVILHLFPLKVFFKRTFRNVKRSIIIGVLPYLDAQVTQSLIIDVKDCKKSVLANFRLGNFIICEENFPSISALVSNIFEIDIDSDILQAINDIESGKIVRESLAYKMLMVKAVKKHVFPYLDIVNLAYNNKWIQIKNWINESFEKIDNKEQIEKRMQEIYDTAVDIDFGKLFLVEIDDRLNLALIDLIIKMSNEKLLILGISRGKDILGCYMKSWKYDLIRVMKNAIKFGFDCAGGSKLIRCKAIQEMNKERFIENISTVLIASLR